MSTELTTVLLLLIFCAGFTAASWRLTPDWKDEVPWNRLVVISGIFAFIVASVTYLYSSLLLPSFAVAIVSYLVPLVFYTDYKIYKIPRRVSRFAYGVAAILPVLYALSVHSWTPIIMVGLSLLVPLVFLFARGMGMGDVRLFILFAFALPWWVGIYGMLVAMGISVVIQTFVFIFGAMMGKGKMHKVKGITGKEKEKRALPFGPALLIGFLMVALWQTQAPLDCSNAISCLEWNLLR